MLVAALLGTADSTGAGLEATGFSAAVGVFGSSEAFEQAVKASTSVATVKIGFNIIGFNITVSLKEKKLTIV
ncbi:hypothetical protein MOMA_01100 [Moraxella macacae 0408225]|uniref:Uncharacterized protein n=1 Tax=Moraxella macacae 0408225 TaxID=1230338 RepID=L2F914_9GAMM|nr:hypothetical protein MOMA_01100 [Moraxella macacae 0408225]